MFGGHLWELVIVLALALVVFGPKRLPEIGGAMGKGIREFKKGTSELSELGDSAAQQPQMTSTVSRPASESVPATPGAREETSPVPPSSTDRTAG
jgi:TatA/E family protein of Tat protein translocase